MPTRAYQEITGAELVFLQSPEAKRLAVAWSKVPGAKRYDLKLWGQLSAVNTWQAEKFGGPLRAAGICRDDGTTSPLALQYIAAEMTRHLPRKTKKRTGGGE